MSQTIKQLLSKVASIREEEMKIAGQPPEETRDAQLGVKTSGIENLSVGSPESKDTALPDPEQAPGENTLGDVENLAPEGGDKPLDSGATLPVEPKKVALQVGTEVKESVAARAFRSMMLNEDEEDGDPDEDDELPPEEEGGDSAPGDTPELDSADQELAGAGDEMGGGEDLPMGSDDGESGNMDDILANVDGLLKAAMSTPELNVQIGIDHSNGDAEPDGDETLEMPPEEAPPEEPAPEMGSENDFGDDQAAMESLLKNV